MKKVPIFIANILIICFIIIFVSLYVRKQRIDQTKDNTDNFINLTIGLERVTTYYLEAEQRLCDSWARFINSNKLSLEEAADYLKTVQAIKTNSAHIIMLDSLTGLSNRPKTDNPNDYTVSYKAIDILSSLNNLPNQI